MSDLRLYLLGPPQVELDGQAVEFKRRKALALLIYLAVSGRPHTRDALATLFWPDHTQRRARAYLRRDLAILNTSLAGEWLEADRDTIALKSRSDPAQRSGPAFWLDVDHFTRLLAANQTHAHPGSDVCSDCLPLLAEAVALYRDDFMAGFSLSDSAEFDDWQFFQAESLRQELGSALERLVRGLSAQGDYEAAILPARRWLALDPLHEPAQRQLIYLYDQAGQPAAALRQYEEYVHLLEEELGFPPEEETTTLYEAIKAKRMLRPFIKTEGRAGRLDEETPAPDFVPPTPELSPQDSHQEAQLEEAGADSILAAQRQDSHDYAADIALLKSMLDHNPADEPVHLELMRLYALTGRHHEALRQYQACAEALATHLDQAPGPETEALYQQIVSGQVTSSATSRPRPAWLPPTPIALEVEGDAPLVGREAELEILLDSIRAARQGRGATILLAGDAGAGKTRLAYEALRTAALFRMTTLMGTAYEQESHLPYQPFIEAIDRYLAEQGRPSDQHPISHYQPIGSSDAQQELSGLFKATATFLSTLASRAPLVLLLDDLHAADEASLSLFHYLARQTRSAPVILLATYRTDLSMHALSPFGSLINALYRERLSQEIQLAPLAEPAAAQIVAHTLGGEAHPDLVGSIFEVAEGNPFFVQEIAHAVLKTDGVTQDNGAWRLQPGVTLQVPSELRALVLERVKRLGPTVETALSAGAVVGREFRFNILREVTNLPDAELLDAVDTALTSQLLEETAEGYRFRHPLIRHALYDALSRVRRAWLHTRVAEAIEATGATRPGGLQPHAEALAFHYDLGDQHQRALPYLLQAGQKAANMFAFEVADAHFERALALMNELGIQDVAQRWPVLEQLGWWALILADTPRAVARFEEALALAPDETGWPGLGDRVRAHRLAARTLISAGDAAHAERHLRAALEEVGDAGDDSADYAYLLHDVGLWHWHRNQFQEAFEVAQRSLQIAQRLRDSAAIARAYEVLALASHSLGEWQAGLDFENRRSALVGPDLDVTEAFDVHL
jgi:DNA-binding SARP family transcriptional activator